MKEKLFDLWYRFVTSNFFGSNIYVFIGAAFWGIISIIITVIVGFVVNINPVLPIEIVNEKYIYHAFNITSTPNSAWICLGISLLFFLFIYFLKKRKQNKLFMASEILQPLLPAFSFFLIALVFHAAALLIAYYGFYYPKLDSL